MEGYQNFTKKNFDPNSLAQTTQTVIMFIPVIDISPSITDFADSMNQAAKELFMVELKNSHRKNDIVVKCITFNEKVEHRSGFTPILTLPDDYLNVAPSGRSTALYQAVLEAMEAAESYRTDLEVQGIEVRTCVFIITDGDDRASSFDAAAKVKDKVNALRKNEAWASTFTINMLGVGEEPVFRNSCIEMGLNPDKCLSTINATAKDLRDQMGVVSKSMSSSTGGTVVNF